MVSEPLILREGRYREIDFFRGAALLIIFWNHLVYLTGVRWRIHYGFSDSAQTFAFLSGFVSALVYGKVLAAKGFWACQKKALKRSAEIFAYHVGIAAVLIVLYLLMPRTAHDPLHSHIASFLDRPIEQALHFVMLKPFPTYYLDILPLYIIMIPFVPAMLLVLRQRIWLAIVIVVGTYCTAQLTAPMTLDLPWSTCTFNPLAWQLMFFIGLLLGQRNVEGRLRIRYSSKTIVPAVLLLLYAIVCFPATQNILRNKLGIFSEGTSFLFPFPYPFTNRTLLEPVIILHFLAFAYVTWGIMWNRKKFWEGRFAGTVVMLGQHSLKIFAIGVILNYFFSWFIYTYGNSTVWFAICVASGWIMMALAAHWFTRLHAGRILARQSER